MNNLVEFFEITDPYTAEFEKAMLIYESSFPENERRPIDSIESMLISGRIRLLVGESNDKIVFMALIYPLIGTPFLLGDYLATAEGYRSAGIGKAFLRYIIDEIRNTQFKYFVIEIENPYLNIDEAKLRRMKFYKRIGMKELKGIRHILPPFQGSEPTELILLAFSQEDEDHLAGEIVSDLMKRIFRELYDRYEGDELLTVILRGIPDVVWLD